MQVHFQCIDYFHEAAKLEEMKLCEAEKHKISYRQSSFTSKDVFQSILKGELSKTSSFRCIPCLPSNFVTKKYSLNISTPFELLQTLPTTNRIDPIYELHPLETYFHLDLPVSVQHDILSMFIHSILKKFDSKSLTGLDFHIHPMDYSVPISPPMIPAPETDGSIKPFEPIVYFHAAPPSPDLFPLPHLQTKQIQVQKSCFPCFVKDFTIPPISKVETPKHFSNVEILYISHIHYTYSYPLSLPSMKPLISKSLSSINELRRPTSLTDWLESFHVCRPIPKRPSKQVHHDPIQTMIMQVTSSLSEIPLLSKTIKLAPMTSFLGQSLNEFQNDFSIEVQRKPKTNTFLFQYQELLDDDTILQTVESTLKKEESLPEPPPPQKSSPFLPILRSTAEDLLQSLQQQAFLPPTCFLHTLQMAHLTDLFETIKSQLASTSSIPSITQTSSILTPLRSALQSVVSLHTLLNLIQGFEQKEDVKITHYCKNLLADPSYQQILPSSILSILQQIASASWREIDSSAPTTIIIDNALLQEHTLLQYVLERIANRILEKEYRVDYVCRDCKGVSCILDINTAVLLLSLANMTADSIRTVIAKISDLMMLYTELVLVISTENTPITHISPLIQYLVAGIILIPHTITLLYTQTDHERAEVVRKLLDESPLLESNWKGIYWDRSFLTEEQTQNQKWLESIPFINPYTACFLDAHIRPCDIGNLQLPNPWLSDSIVENIKKFVNKSCRSSLVSNHQKRSSPTEYIQINKKAKRVSLGIDKSHSVDGQTTICWTELKERQNTRKSPYFVSNSNQSSIVYSISTCEKELY